MGVRIIPKIKIKTKSSQNENIFEKTSTKNRSNNICIKTLMGIQYKDINDEIFFFIFS
jgi:hypothetical protein